MTTQQIQSLAENACLVLDQRVVVEILKNAY